MSKEKLLRIIRRQFIHDQHTTLLSQMVYHRSLMNAQLDEQGYSGRRVMGFKLPCWQRREKWSDEQCLRFIESIWLGVGLGTYMVNESIRNPDADQVLLDGQQRLRAIERYIHSDFSMVGEDGRAYCWNELSDAEQAHFLRIPFPWVRSQYNTDEELKTAYNRHNFGGTPHLECERA